MYEIKLPLTIKSIEQFISPWDIFTTYIDNFPGLDISFKSQLRTGDTNASCRVISINGILLYKDFAETGMLNCYSYVARKYGLSFYETLGKIRNDFNLTALEECNRKLVSTQVVTIPKPMLINHKQTILLKKAREWKLHDKEFWFDRYGITLDWLKAANIEPISSFWIDNHKYNMVEFTCSNHSYSFNYYWHNSIFRRKIYQPFSDVKWISNVDSTIVQGWDILPKTGGDILIITSSYKDAGTIMCNLTNKTIGKQIYAIAPNNEETFLPVPVFEKLKSRWKHILLWYDNDFTKQRNAGLERSIELSGQFGIPWLLTPDNTQKDPSDFRHHCGQEEFIKMTLIQLNAYL